MASTATPTKPNSGHAPAARDRRPVSAGPIRVFDHTATKVERKAAAADAIDYPNSVLRGSTAHVNVYYDPDSLGDAGGAALADGVLANCENDYNFMSAVFGGVAPPTFNVYIAAGIGGAYHYGCSATDLYCDGVVNPAPDLDHTRMLWVAEAVEVFEAVQANGWQCGASNGEGVSRVLATELYPDALDGFTSAASWLDTPDRPNFVDNTDPTDRNYTSIGCSVLFLNFLRYQLDFTWGEIIQAGGGTLAQTYQTLTGQADGWDQFSSLLQAWFPIGTASGVTTDNVFPLTGLNGFPISGAQWQGTLPAGQTVTWVTWGWPEIWNVVWDVVPLTVNASAPQVTWQVQVQRSGADISYWIAVTNLTNADIDIEGRFGILGVI